MNVKQYSFQELSKKMVVNVADGSELGRVCDIVFNACGSVIGFIVPGKKNFWKSLSSQESIFVGWNCIIKIGNDVILTQLSPNVGIASTTQNPDDGNQYAPYQQGTQSTPYRQEQPLQSGFSQTPPYSQPSQDAQPYGAQTIYHTPENK